MGRCQNKKQLAANERHATSTLAKKEGGNGTRTQTIMLILSSLELSICANGSAYAHIHVRLCV